MIFTLREGEHVVKKSGFTEDQIAFALKQAELGTKVDEICRKIGISDATFYKWRQKYGGLGPSELRKIVPRPDGNIPLPSRVSGELRALSSDPAGANDRQGLRLCVSRR